MPFLEQGVAEDDEPEIKPEIKPETAAETEEGVLVNVGSSMAGSSAHVLVNVGKQGLIEGVTGDEAQEADPSGTPTTADFAARRLSVHNPYDGDWNDKGDGYEKEETAAPEVPEVPDTAPLLAELPPPTVGPLSEA